MGKTADLTVVQKTTIDTLHKEGKTQKVIAKEAGCSQSSVSKHINTPISRSRHFEIESEAPVGRNPEVLPLITGAAMSYCCVPGCTSY